MMNYEREKPYRIVTASEPVKEMHEKVEAALRRTIVAGEIDIIPWVVNEVMAEVAPVVDEIEAMRKTMYPIAVWWSMHEAHHQCAERPLPKDEDIILHFMGSGASTTVTAGEIRALRAAFNKRAKPATP